MLLALELELALMLPFQADESDVPADDGLVGDVAHAAVDDDVLHEHLVRSHPPAAVVVKRPVDDHRLQRLAVADHADDFVVVAFVVAVAAEGGCGQRWKFVHRLLATENAS